MLTRWAIVYLLIIAVLLLGWMVGANRYALQEALRERDALESNTSVLRAAMQKMTEDLAAAQAAKDAAVDAANSAQAELARTRSALAAAERTIKEVHEAIDPEGRTREAAERSAHDAREQLGLEKSTVQALDFSRKRMQQPPKKKDADGLSAVTNPTQAVEPPPAQQERSAEDAAPKSASTKKERPRRKQRPLQDGAPTFNWPF